MKRSEWAVTDSQRCTLPEIGKRLGRKALEQVACAVKPDTILGWYRRLIAQKFDGSRYRAYPGRPRTGREFSELVVRMARTYFVDTAFRRHGNEAEIRPGKTSSQHIWRC